MRAPVLDRRRFLSALGLGAAGLGARSLGGRAAWAAEPPKRLILLSTNQGTVYESWRMALSGSSAGPWQAPLAGLAEADFSPILAPLHAHRRRMLVHDGLSLATAELDLAGSRHARGWIHAWTGSWVEFNGDRIQSTAASLDQVVAAAIARPDRLLSLELQVGEGRPICHAGPGLELPLEGDPRRLWNRLFGLADSEDPLVLAQGSVLDFALGEYQGLRGRLAAADRRRLDQHFDLVRQLERRIEGLFSAECDGLDPATLAGSAEGHDALFRSMADLVGAAFSCDLTRVVSLSVGDAPAADIGWGWYRSGDVHFDFAHSVFTDPQCAQAMTDFGAFHARQVAYLVDLLESLPDPDGGSLMDHSLLVWGNELADGWHGFRQWCPVTLGGDWAWSTGRYLSSPWDHLPVACETGTGPEPRCGRPHQQLLTSIAQAMGVEANGVGLTLARSRAGEELDLSGPLPGLRA